MNSIIFHKREALASYDRSKRKLEVETNDLTYEQKFLAMPETLHELSKNLVPIVGKLSENMGLHLSVLSKMSDTLGLVQGQLGRRGTSHGILDLMPAEMIEEGRKKELPIAYRISLA